MRSRRGAGVLLVWLAGCSAPPPAPSPAPPDVAPEIESALAAASAPSASQLPTAAPAPRVRFAGAIACSSKAPGEMRTALSQAKGAGAQLVLDVKPGDQCGLPQSNGLDAALVVVEGTVSAAATNEKGPMVLEPSDALLLPGMGVELRGHTTPATIVVAIAAREGKTLEATLPAAAPWRDRPAPVARTSVAKAEKLSWGSGAFSAQIAFGAPESPNVSLEVLTIEAGAAIPEHEHAEWELLSVLSGGGSLRLASSDRQLEPGQQVAIPAKTKHAFTGGSARTVVVQSYAPAGAEQRFKKLSAEASSPLTK